MVTGAGKGPRCLAGFWALSSGVVCAAHKRSRTWSSRAGLDDGGEACVCVSVRKRKAPTPCFPRGINYSWRGGLSRRVPLGQSRSSSGFGAGGGSRCRSEAHVPLSRGLSQPPRLLWLLTAHGVRQRGPPELTGSGRLA